MKIIDVNDSELCCDLGICKNKATSTITDEGVNSDRQLNLCNECQKKLYQVLNAKLKPQSIPNIFKKNVKE
jgi:hypothetical protein